MYTCVTTVFNVFLYKFHFCIYTKRESFLQEKEDLITCQKLQDTVYVYMMMADFYCKLLV